MRSSLRFYLSREVPFLKQAPNKYSSSSTWNLKPNMPQGLVHNPPASLPRAMNTPKAFLPLKDPRRTAIHHKTFQRSEVDDMPVIYSSENPNKYLATPEVVKEMQLLRSSDPDRWTVNALAKSFGVSPFFVKVTTDIPTVRKAKIEEKLAETKQNWSRSTKEARQNRKKRVELWLRSEY